MKKIPTKYVVKILEDADLKKNDLRVLLYLCETLSSKKVREFKNKTILKDLGIDKSTLSTSIKTLIDKDFICKHEGRIFEKGFTLNFDENFLNGEVYVDNSGYNQEDEYE